MQHIWSRFSLLGLNHVGTSRNRNSVCVGQDPIPLLRSLNYLDFVGQSAITQQTKIKRCEGRVRMALNMTLRSVSR